MAVYMVERDLPGVTMDQLAAAQKAAIDTGRQFTEEGKNVRYILTTGMRDFSMRTLSCDEKAGADSAKKSTPAPQPKRRNIPNLPSAVIRLG